MQTRMAGVILCVLAAAISAAEPVDLMPGGVAPRIVTPDKGLSAFENAGLALLQKTLEQITARRPNVVKESAGAPGPGALWYGLCKASQEAFGDDLKGLDNDGFIVRARDGVLYIVGPAGTGHGSLNGAVDFLKRDLGCRWYMPGEFGSVIPRRADLKLDVQPRRVEPAFRARVFYLQEDSWRPGDTEWFINANRRHIRLQFHHNMHRVLPPSRFAKDHPEWYCEIDGARRPPSQDTTSAWQPCMTNPEGIRAAAQTIMEQFRKDPQLKTFSIGVNDGGRHCECAACKAKYLADDAEKERGRYGRLYFEWADAVARIVEKEFPDAMLGCLSYGGAYVPPADLKLSRLVLPLAVMPTFRSQNPEVREDQDRRAQRLSERCANWGLYDWYYGYGMLFPLPIHHLLQQRLQFYQKLGARAIYYETYPNWGLDGHKYALMNDLLWDPGLDVDAWLDDFCKGFFGAAAQPMRKVLALWEDAYMGRPASMEKPGLFSDTSFAHVTPQMYEQSADLFAAALKKADSLAARQRVQFYAAALRGSEILVGRQWRARDAQAALDAGRPDQTFAALALLHSPAFDYAEYSRQVLDALPLRAMQRPTYHMGLMASGTMLTQTKLLQVIEHKLGRPASLLAPTDAEAAAVEQALDAITGGRSLGASELAFRERLRDMLRRTARVKRVAAAPVVDGKDDDACWKEAQPLGDFVTLPSGDPPKYRTEARMAYDDKNLYLLLVAYQAKDTLWRETGGGRDDRIWCDDAVEFFVNRPDAKDKEYVQIIASAWGGIYDHYNGNPRFNADLTCKTQILDDRFVIEMAVAWASLPNIGPQDRLLRVNFQRGKRTRADYEEVSDWFPASNAQDLTARGWMVLAP